MPKYTSEAKINTFLGITITAGSADDAISSVEKYIDNYTGRNFKADTVATERLFSGNGRQTMLIDECTEITKVELGNDFYGDNKSEIASSGIDSYIKMPTNYSAYGLPVNELWLRSRIWIEGLQNHRITAKWGYSVSAPADIVWVATFLSSSLYRQGINGNVGGVSSERIGEYSVNFSDTEQNDYEKAKEILNKYKLLLI